MKTAIAVALASALGLACILPAPGFAQALTPGTYTTERGWGTLKLRQDGTFSLDSQGSNGHTCELEGRIVRGRAALEDGCVVDFKREGAAIRVSPGNRPGAPADACRAQCGARASFDGDYFPQQPACRDEAVQSARDAFLADYKARRYRPAAARLEKLLGACGRFLWWMTEAEVRNDLALAQHRAGRSAACLATLKPLDRLLDGQTHFPPLEQDWADEVLPRIRFNRQLCGQAPAPRHGSS